MKEIGIQISGYDSDYELAKDRLIIQSANSTNQNVEISKHPTKDVYYVYFIEKKHALNHVYQGKNKISNKKLFKNIMQQAKTIIEQDQKKQCIVKNINISCHGDNEGKFHLNTKLNFNTYDIIKELRSINLINQKTKNIFTMACHAGVNQSKKNYFNTEKRNNSKASSKMQEALQGLNTKVIQVGNQHSIFNLPIRQLISLVDPQEQNRLKTIALLTTSTHIHTHKETTKISNFKIFKKKIQNLISNQISNEYTPKLNQININTNQNLWSLLSTSINNTYNNITTKYYSYKESISKSIFSQFFNYKTTREKSKIILDEIKSFIQKKYQKLEPNKNINISNHEIMEYISNDILHFTTKSNKSLIDNKNNAHIKHIIEYKDDIVKLLFPNNIYKQNHAIQTLQTRLEKLILDQNEASYKDKIFTIKNTFTQSGEFKTNKNNSITQNINHDDDAILALKKYCDNCIIDVVNTNFRLEIQKSTNGNQKNISDIKEAKKIIHKIETRDSIRICKQYNLSLENLVLKLKGNRIQEVFDNTKDNKISAKDKKEIISDMLSKNGEIRTPLTPRNEIIQNESDIIQAMQNYADKKIINYINNNYNRDGYTLKTKNIPPITNIQEAKSIINTILKRDKMIVLDQYNISSEDCKDILENNYVTKNSISINTKQEEVSIKEYKNGKKIETKNTNGITYQTIYNPKGQKTQETIFDSKLNKINEKTFNTNKKLDIKQPSAYSTQKYQSYTKPNSIYKYSNKAFDNKPSQQYQSTTSYNQYQSKTNYNNITHNLKYQYHTKPDINQNISSTNTIDKQEYSIPSNYIKIDNMPKPTSKISYNQKIIYKYAYKNGDTHQITFNKNGKIEQNIKYDKNLTAIKSRSLIINNQIIDNQNSNKIYRSYNTNTQNTPTQNKSNQTYQSKSNKYSFSINKILENTKNFFYQKVPANINKNYITYTSPESYRDPITHTNNHQLNNNINKTNRLFKYKKNTILPNINTTNQNNINIIKRKTNNKNRSR